jgi:hypothetical protein
MVQAREFTGWIGVDGGLVNLAHVRRIVVVSVEKVFLVVAYLEDDDQVTLATTEDRAVADKALRYLAANVKAIYPVRS